MAAPGVPEGVEDVAVLLGVGGGLLVAGPVGVGELLVFAVAEGDGLVGGESCVGVGEDRSWLDVGLADVVGAAVRGAVSTLVPPLLPVAAVAGTEAVAGVPSWLAVEVGDFVVAVIVDDGEPPVESSRAMMAATPNAARLMPPIRRARCRGLEPADRSVARF
jgi:hypothetical protein